MRRGRISRSRHAPSRNTGWAYFKISCIQPSVTWTTLTLYINVQEAVNGVKSTTFCRSFGGVGWGGVFATCVPIATERFRSTGIRNFIAVNEFENMIRNSGGHMRSSILYEIRSLLPHVHTSVLQLADSRHLSILNR